MIQVCTCKSSLSLFRLGLVAAITVITLQYSSTGTTEPRELTAFMLFLEPGPRARAHRWPAPSHRGLHPGHHARQRQRCAAMGLFEPGSASRVRPGIAALRAHLSILGQGRRVALHRQSIVCGWLGVCFSVHIGPVWLACCSVLVM